MEVCGFILLDRRVAELDKSVLLDPVADVVGSIRGEAHSTVSLPLRDGKQLGLSKLAKS